MEKQRIYALTAEQMAQFEKEKSGAQIVPDGFEVYVVPSGEDLRKRRITELEAELAKMVEPSKEELIEAGKMMHPYYMLVDEIKILRGE